MSDFENFKVKRPAAGYNSFNPNLPAKITVTTTSQDLGPLMIEQLQELLVYLTNSGAVTLNYTIYGSPTGLVSGDRDGDGVEIPQADIDLDWTQLATGTVAAANEKPIDMSSLGSYNYIKISVSTSSGSTTMTYHIMHKGTN